MATYRRETVIDAPLEDVWAFHSTIDGLKALTPSFMHLEVHRITGPNGETTPDELDVGSRIEMSVRPLGIAPTQEIVSVITERQFDGSEGSFCDIMETGPFPTWKHTHRFIAEGDRTRLIDRIEYELPGGALGRMVSPLGRIGFAPMFRNRHRTTKRLLEA